MEGHYKMYGKVKEAVVLVDKKGNSKGYGFVTFDNATSALEAAKDPKKRIDNRVTHCNLAFKGIFYLYNTSICLFILYLLCKDEYLKIIPFPFPFPFHFYFMYFRANISTHCILFELFIKDRK